MQGLWDHQIALWYMYQKRYQKETSDGRNQVTEEEAQATKYASQGRIG